MKKTPHTNLRKICEKCKVPFCPDCWEDCPTCEPKEEVARIFPNYQTLPVERKKDFLELIIKWSNQELELLR
jgi:hypothetical protein